MEKKLQKICLTYYNLLVAQSLSQTHYQILPITFLEKFIKLNVNTDSVLKNVKPGELNIEQKCLCCINNYLQKFDETLKEQFFNTYKFCNGDSNKFFFLSIYYGMDI